MSEPRHRPLLLGEHTATATDLYQITMMYAYFTAGLQARVSFEYFVRKLPQGRRFLVFAGLEQVLAYLRDLRFTGEEIDHLRTLDTFQRAGDPAARERFFEWLRGFRFEGLVRAAPEGTVFFPNEPVLQVQGELLGCQLVETYLLSMLNYQTLVASKAARVRLAAGPRTLMDFGSRRGHGPQAGVLAARAACVGGFDGTSNVLAGRLLGVPVMGTAAHAYTMSFDREEDAFAHYMHTFPDNTTVLIDTYDTVRGATRAAALGPKLKGVRLDSGDLLDLSKQVRRVLNQAGLLDTKIVASNDLNEHSIAKLLAGGAPIDTFGVGTELITSKDDPTLAGVYKLVERVEGGVAVPTMKFAADKPSYPGTKDLYRVSDADGTLRAGLLTQQGEPPQGLPEGQRAEPLLELVMRDGRPTAPPPPLGDLRARAQAQITRLPASRRLLDPKGGPGDEIPLLLSAQTQEKIEQCRERFSVERT